MTSFLQHFRALRLRRQAKLLHFFYPIRSRQDHLRAALFSNGKAPELTKKDGDGGDEGSCAAFGYLHGIRYSSTSVEFRFLSGNSMWFPNSWLGPWRYDPSEGLLLKFSGDVVYLVLIKGRKFDKPLTDGSINLTPVYSDVGCCGFGK